MTRQLNRLLFRHRYFITGILCLFGLCVLSAQDKTPKTPPGKMRIDLLHANEASADKNFRPDIQVLTGDVKLKHNNMLMYCDSALIYEKVNSVEAFGHVRMEQGDTLFIYGDYLNYDGYTQIAILRENVKLINRKTILTTDSLNYDRVLDLGYYFEGGKLTDEDNVLTSQWGEYSPGTKQAVFNHNVQLVNPKFTLHSDTLEYSTLTKVATILGPSTIQSDNSRIYSSNGVYNTVTEQGELLDRSVLIDGGKRLVGDSLFYDKQKGYGEAFNNVVMNDTVNKNMITGNYCYYDELSENALATDRAVAIDYSQGDSLYMHADTLRMISFFPNTDSVYRHTKAYHKVRVYRRDVQAVCDSLIYSTKDSCLTLFYDPILWNGNQQLLGEQIRIFMNDSTIEKAHILNQALAVEKVDSVRFNQVTGKEMTAFFKDKEIHQTDVNGNVLVIYYPFDDKDSTLIGMDYTEGSFLTLSIKEKKMQRGLFKGKTTGTLYPLAMVPAGKDKLAAFAWFDDIRPRSREDIFEWKAKSAGQELKKNERRPAAPPQNMGIKHTKKR